MDPAWFVRGEVQVPGDLIFTYPIIRRVFAPLTENEIRHGEKVTVIRYPGKIRGKDFVIICQDDGMSIAPGDKERIIEHG